MAEKHGHTPVVPAMTYTAFAKAKGFATDYDIQGHIHGGLMAAHMPQSYHRRYQKKLVQLQDSRAAGIKAYRAALARREISAPQEPSSLERLLIKAAGEPDRESTLAAQRVLAKRIARASNHEGEGV